MQPVPYPAPQQQAPQPKKGFPVWAMVLLGCLGAFLLLGGVLAVLGIYGMRKYLANAKTAEAMNSLGQIAKDEAAAYESGSVDPHGGGAHRLCPSASRSVPPSLSAVTGKKYQSSPAEWTVDAPSHAGFACLKFSLDAPQYYMYSYEATPGSFDATAQGDLNGDGVTSKFVVRGKVSSGGALQIEPNLERVNPEE